MLTAVAERGFIGASGTGRRRVALYSLILLVVSFLSVVWTFLIDADMFLEIGAPLLPLFRERKFVVARMRDAKVRQSGVNLALPMVTGAQTEKLDLST